MTFVLASLALGVPLWLVARPPMEDFPQHVAITAVLANLRASPDLVADFGRTPHVGWYALAVVLSKLLGPVVAAKLLVSASLSSIPLALRFLVARLGGTPRVAWVVLPVVWSGFVAYGFVQFVAGVPLMLLALALAAGERLSRPHLVGLGLVLLATFSVHLLCAAVAGLGVIALRASRDGKGAWRTLLVPAGAGLIAMVWTLLTDAGADLLVMAGLRAGGEVAPAPARFLPAAGVIPDALEWLSNLTRTEVDDRAFWLWGALVAGCAVARRERAWFALPWSACVGLLVALALLSPQTVGWIWPLGARFAWLAVILGVAGLSLPRGALGGAVITLSLLATVVRVADVARAYVNVERHEQAGLTEVIAALPPGSRLCGVVHDSHSEFVPWWPHHFSAAWAQAERGGSLVFSFVAHPSTPLRFRADVHPPQTGPTGFNPDRVASERMTWCDHVIVYQGPGAFEYARAHELTAHHGRFRLYTRRPDPR